MTTHSITLAHWLALHTETALASVLLDLAHASTEIAGLVRGGALTGALGSLDNVNVQGETQKRLDVLANDICKRHLAANPAIAAIASEEEDNAIVFARPDAAYLVAFDPLDGSSNIDVNVTVGTIFSILPAPATTIDDTAFLQSGHRQVAAGYVVYGPQICLLLALPGQVVQFTADPASGEFLLTHDRLSIPAGARVISANVSNQSRWPPDLAATIQQWLDSGDYNMRWVGSMVADIHRILHQGGVFLYPTQSDRPQGKLRLLYECNPIGFIIENAQGSAADTLQTTPTSLHQRVGFIAGDQEAVTTLSDHST
ncbi:class 1 fructose-1,6-bisphosphatase [Devosia sp. ZW T5_3]|uniref:class 1 fructose-bisphosphatase n=1 Tax=Devosia sp. ZW T5_3 TaxID=3378085 RepID=UPI003854AD7B